MFKQRLDIPVDEYVSPIQTVATEEMKVSEIRQIMFDKGYRHIPVVKDSKYPIGIISDRDISLLDSLENLSDL